jgi:hypothetical protein
MKVLVATNELQGAVEGDYARGVDGELVTGVVAECCDGDACGCSRGWIGLGSSQATTTAMVVERQGLGADDVRDAVREYLRRSGWVELITAAIDADVSGPDAVDDPDGICRGDDPAEVIDEIVDEHIERIDEVCAHFPEGTVVSRRGTNVIARVVRRVA